MKITREKRPDRVICKWGDYRVNSLGDIVIIYGKTTDCVTYPKSEIPNLIKALEEIQK